MSTALSVTAANTPLIQAIVSGDLLLARKFIPDDVFPLVLNWVPITTVDFVPTRTNQVIGQKEFCLGFRTEQPFQNTWFVTGGRKNYGESTYVALAHQVKRELGLDIGTPGVDHYFRGVVDVLNPASDGPNGRPEWHSNWLLHEICLGAGIEPVARAENAAVRWFTHIHPDFPEPVRQALVLIGFSETETMAGSPI